MTTASSDWQSRILKKKARKIGISTLGPTDLNQVQNEVFCHFLEFGSLVFLEITYNDSLKQCLTSNRGKAHE